MASKVQGQWYIKPDWKLDLILLLKEFQKFYRRHSESWLGNFSFQESGKQLLLMAFLSFSKTNLPPLFTRKTA
jgi:hypothetical protein